MTAEYVIADLQAAAEGALDGTTLTPFAPQKRAPEWGKRAIIMGNGPQVASWVRDLGRRAVTVDLAPERHLRDVDAALGTVISSRAAIVVVVGDIARRFVPAIVETLPELAIVVAAGTETVASASVDNPEQDIEFVEANVVPRQLVHAIRRALRTSLMRKKLHAFKAENARQRQELDRLNADAQASLTQRHRAVCDTKRAWEKTFDAVSTPLAVVDRQFVVLNANRAYASVAGEEVSRVPGRHCHEVLFGRPVACDGCPRKERKERSEVSDDAGRTFEVSSTMLDDGMGTFVCTYRDLTEERDEFEERIRTERMSALGEMSAGLAHELNNPIAGILAMAQALSRDPDVTKNADLALDLADIEEAANRSKRILRALLRYARGQGPGNEGTIDLAQAISDAFIVAKAELRNARIVVDVTAEPGANHAKGDQSSFQEAMVHLLRNAADAVAPNSVDEVMPKVTIRTLLQGNEVWVEVADNGRGLPSVDPQALLIPFVSGSERAQGKGLGLALVSRLIENGMGRVELLPHAGGGATVRLRLRVAAP